MPEILKNAAVLWVWIRELLLLLLLLLPFIKTLTKCNGTR